MKKELYPFQVLGADFHCSRPHSGNADEMGLGKTLQAIETVNRTKPDNVLIITPATIKINWKRELEEWLTHSLSVGIVNGSAWVDEQVTIINYDILERHVASIHKKRWDMVIVDEAHYIKNLESMRTNAVLGIPAGRKLWMTGTPILNRPVELVPLLYYIEAITDDKFQRFYNRYCNAQLRRGWNPKKKEAVHYWDYKGHAHLEELAENFAPWIIRRTKAEVLPQLPKKIRQVVELGSQQNGLVDQWLSQFRKKVESATTLREYEQALRKFEMDATLEFGEWSTRRREDGMSKLHHVIPFLKDAVEGSGKVVCFAHHREFISEIRRAFGKNSVAIVGGMSTEAKQAAIDQFVSDPGIGLLVGNIKAAGVGVDGLQKVCSHAIFAELETSPKIVEQAEDRLVRIGQTKPTLIQHLISDGSIDVILAKIMVAKQYVIEKVVK